MVWDLSIVMLNIINIMLVPLEVAFKPEFTNDVGFIFFEYLFDFIFLVDIIFNLRTSFMDEDGNEIDEPKLIAKRYIPTF
jgi:hypothetical protein